MKAAVLQALVLVVLSAGAGLLSYRLHPEAPALYLYMDTQAAEGEVTIARAQELERTVGVLWIDARVRPEYEKGHVPGALLINEQEWDSLISDAFETIARNEKPIIVYCDAQQCDASHNIAEKLRNLGQPDVHVLAGGWNAWKSAQAK